MRRRQFLQLSAAPLFLPLLPVRLVEAPVVWEIEGTHDSTIRMLFSKLGGLKQLIKTDLSRATVLIKPNLCLPHTAEMGTISNPNLLNTLCRFLSSEGISKIIIADHTLRDENKFKNHFISELADKYKNVKLIIANEQRLYKPANVPGKNLHTTEMLKIAHRADLMINLATAKHHSATTVSLAIKNLMGLIWNRSEFHTDLDLSQAIADLALLIRPGLNIIDTSTVLLDGGPTGPGPVLQDNRIFAGFDILALDSVVISRYNFGGKSRTAKEIPHLWAASQNSVGEIDRQKIELNALKI